MNIIGEGFNNEILNQVTQRQKIYGSANRSNQVLSYLNSKTGWCKLVSGAIVEKNIRDIGIPNAQDYVLFNGMVDEGKKLGTGGRAGIARTNSINTDTAYGLGGLEQGNRPMPGIISANVKTETRGSLKTATVQIKAWNRNQFDIIDVLYLRLGFSVLLEWGHSSYYNNNNVYISNNPHSIADIFLSGKQNYDDILKLIQTRRLDSNGNYDAIFGKVVNFSWSFGSDGSYDITLTLRSIGDVIESLKINLINPNPENKQDPNQTETPPEPTPDSIIVAAKDKNSISNFFYLNQQKFQTNSQYFTSPPDKTNVGMKWLTNVIPSKDGKEHIDIVQQLFVGGENGKDRTEYYIRLGTFLEFIEQKIVPTLKDKNGNNITSLKFNTDTETNLIYIAPRQISADPRVCIFKRTFTIKSNDTVVATKYLFNECESFQKTFSGTNNFYGKLMNVYLNFTFILGELDNLKNSDTGDVSLIDFLKSLTTGICNSTGNFNNLDVIISPNQDDLVTIIDAVPLPNRDEILSTLGISTKKVIFDVYGYYNKNKIINGSSVQSAGFIKDFQMRTEITPQMSSMITIGATSNGNIVGSDSTALSRLNSGIIDRYKVAINDPETPQLKGDETKTLEERFKIPLENFNKFLDSLSSKDYQTKPQWNLEAIEAYSSTIQDFLTYEQAKQSEKEDKGSPTIGFLPFNLTLKMEGLSGMKVYQKYTIDTSYLPTNYPNNLDFLIRSITHDISNNVWDTTIESIAVPNNVSGTGLGNSSEDISPSKTTSRGGNPPIISNVCPVASINSAPPTNQPTSPIRSKALTTAYKYTFYNDGKSNQPESHLCSKYTYTHAYNYVNALRNKASLLKSGGQISAGGNANQLGYWTNLVKLGYTQTKLGTGIDKSQIINLISSTPYNYGDVIVYWASDNPTDKGASQYGHTQIYIGGTIPGVIWTSDRYTNYSNSAFVYLKKNYTCWNLILFRAPLS
jgi:hypothetical protein